MITRQQIRQANRRALKPIPASIKRTSRRWLPKSPRGWGWRLTGRTRMIDFVRCMGQVYKVQRVKGTYHPTKGWRKYVVH